MHHSKKSCDNSTFIFLFRFYKDVKSVILTCMLVMFPESLVTVCVMTGLRISVLSNNNLVSLSEPLTDGMGVVRGHRARLT